MFQTITTVETNILSTYNKRMSDKIDELLTRGVANIIPNKDALEKVLNDGKKLNIYLGIDPTATRIHLGHAVPLRKLQKFAEQGHNVTFLIGDFTALIGDTSDKDSERPALSIEEIEENFKTYKKQAEKILDFSKIKIEYNSKWLKKLSFEDILKLMHHFSAGDFVGRELIKKRLSENKRVGLHELLYPVMQGYDSFMLNTDLQIGGTDQTFNMQTGRTLIKDIKNKESFVLSTPILEGPDGRKMSKSWGNAIWLDDNATDMYAKILSVNDDLIIQYFTLATNLSLGKISIFEQRLKKENPINIKKELAYQIVSELYDKKSAEKAREDFEKIVQKKEMPNNTAIETQTIHLKAKIGDVLIEGGLAKSKSNAKRLIEQGGVSLNDKKIIDVNFETDEGILRVGKRKIKKLVLE